MRTGYKHLGQTTDRNSLLAPPTHTIDENLFVFRLPFAAEPEPGAKNGSRVIIFSCWNTCIGSAIVALPWAFQQSGMVLGLLISFTSFVVSFYTCKLIIDTAEHDPDFSDTL